MKIYSWNVNGIRAVWNKGEFQKFISKHNPDMLCLQETKATQGDSPVELTGYEEYWNSATKKGYAGTAIFSKIKPISIINDIPDEIANKYLLEDRYGKTNQEGSVIAAEYEDFFLVTVYTPNSKGDLSRLKLREQAWDKAFLEYVDSLQAIKSVIFCGDLNVAHTEDDLARPKENVGKHGFTDEERAGFEKILQKGFTDTFRLFTNGNGNYSWWTHWANARARNIGWRIDYFLVSQQLKPQIKSAKIHSEQMGSDHCPVSIEITK